MRINHLEVFLLSAFVKLYQKLLYSQQGDCLKALSFTYRRKTTSESTERYSEI